MTYSIRIEDQDRLLLTRIDGAIDARAMIDGFAAAIADPAFDPAFDDLVVEGPTCDLSALRAADIPAIVAAHDAALQGHPRYTGAYCRTAVLTQPTVNRAFLSLITAIWEQHGAVVDDMKVCKTLAEAARWLNRPEARLQSIIKSG